MGHRVRVVPRLFLGKGDADLHRAAGVHRVQAAEQAFTQGHHANEVIEDRAQLPLGTGGIQALVVGFARGRGDVECTAHEEGGDVQLAGATVDLGACDFGQARHGWVSLEGRFLFSHRQHGTQVFVAGREPLRGKRCIEISGPALAIRGFGRH